ncbi:hypothetical protein Tco_1447255 [Tanacetum coccineum]
MSPAFQRQFENYPPKHVAELRKNVFEKPAVESLTHLANHLKRKEKSNKGQACLHCPFDAALEEELPLYIEELVANKNEVEDCGRDYDLEDDHIDTLPSENTSEIPENLKVWRPTSEINPVIGDLGEPANYKTAMLDPDKMNLSRGKHIHDLRKLRNYLGRLFMKILEKLHTFGIKIYEIDLSVDWTIKCLHLYKILKKFSMQNSKKGFIPMEVKHDLSNEMCASSDEKKAYMKKVPYASVSVDLSCMLSGGTRPDVESSSKLGSDSFIQR